MNGWHLRLALECLRRGGVVIHPTEGVWGAACDPADRAAVAELLRLKGRALDKGLIVIGAGPQCFAAELAAVSDEQRECIAASWPGAVTWILPNRRFGRWITGGRTTVAVRVPGHAGCRALCRAFGGPLVSTSANSSGRAAARNRWQARAWLRELGRGRRSAAPLYLLPGETLGRAGPSELRTADGRRLPRRR